jgi:hypothetical protein
MHLANTGKPALNKYLASPGAGKFRLDITLCHLVPRKSLFRFAWIQNSKDVNFSLPPYRSIEIGMAAKGAN